MATPIPTKRNDPCWCGSGKKYKKCHWQADQQAAAERAAKAKARQAQLDALGHPNDAELRARFETLTGRAAPPGPLPTQAHEAIVEMWQQEKLAEQARGALEPERAQWAEYFEGHPEEFEEIATEIARDPFFDQYELLPQNVKKVSSQLGPLPDEADPAALRAYTTEAIALSLDESDRDMFNKALLALLPDLIEEGNIKAAYVVDSCAQRALDPTAPLSPFLEDVVIRSLRPTPAPEDADEEQAEE